MAITVLTLANATATGTKIYDRVYGKEVSVEIVGHVDEKHPIYVLCYEDGTRREVKWQSGQGVPSEELYEAS